LINSKSDKKTVHTLLKSVVGDTL